MTDICSIRSAMLMRPEMWKGSPWMYEIVKIITASELIFLPDEDWNKIYNETYNVVSAISAIASRVRIFVPKNNPQVNPNDLFQLKSLIRLASFMSFCRVMSKDFNDIRFCNGEAFLPEGAHLEIVESSTFSELILMAMKKYGSKISTDIFDIIIEDTRIWFQTVLIPISSMRTKAISRVLENYGQKLGDDIIYWLAYKRIFSGDVNFVKNIANDVNTKIKQLKDADNEGYIQYDIKEEKFCADVYNKLQPWMDFYITEYDKNVLTIDNGKIVI